MASAEAMTSTKFAQQRNESVIIDLTHKRTSPQSGIVVARVKTFFFMIVSENSFSFNLGGDEVDVNRIITYIG